MDSKFWTDLGIALANAMIPVLAVAVPTITTALVALFVQGIRLLQAKIKSENPSTYEILTKICADAVSIAEQLHLKESGIEIAEKKKAWAIAYVQTEADKLGLVVDVEEIGNMIEKAVFEELNKK